MSLDLDKIKKELEILPEYNEQIALQKITKDNLDPFYACGAEIFNNTTKENTSLIHPYLICRISIQS